MTASDASEPVRPTQRNPLVTWLIPTLCFVAAPPLGNFLGQTAFRLAPSFAMVAGVLITLFTMQRMTAELNSVTGNKLVGWHYLIPVYGLYWAFSTLRNEVAAAKVKAGKPPAGSGLAYLFLGLYAFSADLNDLTAPR